MKEQPIFTLEDFARVARGAFAHEIAEDILRPNPLLDHLMRDYVSPTRAQRIHRRIVNLARRVRDAWAVLNGRAEAEYE